jgi:hypothetical protein
MQAGIQKLPKDLGSYLESHVAFWPSLTAGLPDNTLGANHAPAQAAHPGQPGGIPLTGRGTIGFYAACLCKR